VTLGPELRTVAAVRRALAARNYSLDLSAARFAAGGPGGRGAILPAGDEAAADAASLRPCVGLLGAERRCGGAGRPVVVAWAGAAAGRRAAAAAAGMLGPRRASAPTRRRACSAHSER
jgi:hypothetical protein